jgi:hypothetical protein
VAKSQQPKKPTNAKFSGQTAAQRRLAAKQAVARASASRAAQRKRRWVTVYTPIIVILIIVLVMVLVKALGSSGNTKGNTATDAGQVATLVTSVPASDLDKVGIGTSQSPPTSDTSGQALTANGKPKVLYVGTEWCPFCAAERWPLTVALSRFGTFTGLQITKSSPDDVHPNTPTVSYANATYTSQYVYFDANELEDGDHNVIKTLSPENKTIFESKGSGSYPFIDFGGLYVLNGAQYDPGILAGKSQLEVAQTLTNTESAISQAVLGSANVLTAAICKATKNQPQNVCTSSGVMAGFNALQ